MQFADFARAHGLIIRDLQAGDRIHRCATVDHPRSTNGAYFFDGRRGWVQRWDAGDEVIWWEDDREWTPAEQAEWDKKRLLYVDQKQKAQDKATSQAQALIEKTPVGVSPYLSYKGIADNTSHIADDVTIVPMRDFWSDRLTSVQYISWNPATRKYDKKFMPGGKTSGAVYKIGRGNETWFCEGFATGKSLKEALDFMRIRTAVVCTFSAHNLVKVAKGFRGRAFVFADHDASGVGAKAAEDTGLPWLMSPVEGQDANDYHQKEGLLRLCRLIQNFQMSIPVVEIVDSKPETGGLSLASKENDLSPCLADGFVRNGNTKTNGIQRVSL